MNKAALGKYGAVIQKARKPENQKPGLPEETELVNLSIKVPRHLRQRWVAEAKRQGTTLTQIIKDALNERFQESE